MIFNFGDNQQVSDINNVPEQFRSLYGEVEGGDGTYKIKNDDPTVKGAVEAIIGLNSALLAARGDVKKAKEGKVDLSPLSEYGSDVQTIQAKIEEIKTQLAEASKGNKDTPPVDVEKLKGEFAKTHAAEIKARDDKLEGLNAQLHKVLVTNALTTAVAEVKGNPDLLMPMLANKVKAVVNDQGEMQVYVVDPAGDRRYSGVSGQEMTIPELMAEIKSDTKYAGAFQSESNSGGGMPPRAGITPGPGAPNRELTSREKIAQGLAKKVRN